MKKIILSALLGMFSISLTFPCTNLLVGKKASADGSTIISYAADSYGLYGELYHWPAKQYRPGEKLGVYDVTPESTSAIFRRHFKPTT